MEKRVLKFENQVVLGISRFGVDYNAKILVPLGRTGTEIAFADFGRGRNGAYTILQWDENNRQQRFEKEMASSPYNLSLPARIFSGPFVNDEAFVKSCNYKRRINGYILLDKATILRIEDSILPRILINGKHWEVDGYNQVLNDPLSKGIIMRIPMNIADFTDDGRYFVFPYKGGHGFLDYLLLEEMREVPNNLMMVRMLLPSDMDPVGHAISLGKLPTELLYQRPYKAYHNAVPLSWAKAGLVDFIIENRAKAKLEPLPKSAYRVQVKKESDDPISRKQQKKGRRL